MNDSGKTNAILESNFGLYFKDVFRLFEQNIIEFVWNLKQN